MGSTNSYSRSTNKFVWRLCVKIVSYCLISTQETSQTIPGLYLTEFSRHRNSLVQYQEMHVMCQIYALKNPSTHWTSCNVSKSKEGFGLRQQRQHVISTRHRMMMLSRASHHATKPDQNIPAPPPVIFSAHPEQERSHAIVSSISQQHSKHVKETHPLAAPGRAVLRHPSR